MFYSAVLVATAALASFATAQNASSYSLSAVIGAVSYVERQSWCRGQTNNCPLICEGSASPNTCDPNTLQYVCTCTNGAMPNISNYGETVPSYVCAEQVKLCVDGNPNNLDAITSCRNVNCGQANASNIAGGSSSSSSMTASMTSSASGGAASASGSSTTGSASASKTSATAAATSSGAAAVMHVASNYGTGILATALLAVFGLAL